MKSGWFAFWNDDRPNGKPAFVLLPFCLTEKREILIDFLFVFVWCCRFFGCWNDMKPAMSFF